MHGLMTFRCPIGSTAAVLEAHDCVMVRCRKEEEGLRLVLALCGRQGFDRFDASMLFGLIPASSLALVLIG